MILKRRSEFPKINLFVFFIAITLLSVPATLWADQPRICVEGKRELRASYELLQGQHGGIWGLFEKFNSLKEKSFMGLQLDGKLQMAIVRFETRCKEGTPPDEKVFDQIFGLISETRVIFSLEGVDGAPDKILTATQGVIQKTDALLSGFN